MGAEKTETRFLGKAVSKPSSARERVCSEPKDQVRVGGRRKGVEGYHKLTWHPNHRPPISQPFPPISSRFPIAVCCPSHHQHLSIQ